MDHQGAIVIDEGIAVAPTEEIRTIQGQLTHIILKTFSLFFDWQMREERRVGAGLAVGDIGVSRI